MQKKANLLKRVEESLSAERKRMRASPDTNKSKQSFYSCLG